jgi:hypothetical protein
MHRRAYLAAQKVRYDQHTSRVDRTRSIHSASSTYVCNNSALTALTILHCIQNGLLTSLFAIKRHPDHATCVLHICFVPGFHKHSRIIILTWQMCLTQLTVDAMQVHVNISSGGVPTGSVYIGLLRQRWRQCVLWMDYTRLVYVSSLCNNSTLTL